jgi:NAD(P)-dependent dehydrogenase (short-subunit alcohol dehydrogenase family)
VVADVDLTGKRAVATGSWAGIGAETARMLAGASAEGVLAVRRSAAGEEAAAQISAQTGNPPGEHPHSRSRPPAWDVPLHVLRRRHRGGVRARAAAAGP